MTDFWFFTQLGFKHVLDWQAYDHILFLMVLCLPYSVRAWRSLLWLVSLFTLGHTLSLILASYELVLLPKHWIEFLIPVSILIMAIKALIKPGKQQKQLSKISSITTLFFGLIHGFGFASFFAMTVPDTKWMPLAGFAFGVELAQALIVTVMVFAATVALHLTRIALRDWVLVVAGIVTGLTLPFLVENWIF